MRSSKGKTTSSSRPLGDQPRGGLIGQIIKLHESGKSKAEIIALGFNKSTVSRQVGEYIKRQQK